MMNQYYEDLIKKEADRLSNSISNKVIRNLQTYKRDSGMMQSSDDSGLDNIWDEICVQTQYEYYVVWFAYEKFVFDTVMDILKKSCNNEQIQMLWLQSDDYSDWLADVKEDDLSNSFDKNGCPSDCGINGVANFIFDKVIQLSQDYRNKRIEDYLYSSELT